MVRRTDCLCLDLLNMLLERRLHRVRGGLRTVRVWGVSGEARMERGSHLKAYNDEPTSDSLVIVSKERKTRVM